MKWKNFYEAIGVVAILIGLAFVYRELQLIGTIARAELSAETARNIETLSQMRIESDFADVYVKSVENPEALTRAERIRLNIWLGGILEQYLRECYYVEIGIFQECDSYPRGTALRFFSSRYGRAFWQVVRNRMVGPKMTAIIDAELARVPLDDIELQIDAGVLQNLNEAD